jgi:hypothetical protein
LSTRGAGRNSEQNKLSVGKTQKDDEVCRQILESDPAIRVAAFIEGTEVSGYAEATRTKNILSQNTDLREKIGLWSKFITEMSRQTDQLFGKTESICLTHKALKLVTVPLSPSRSLGLSLDRSSDQDHLLLKLMAKFSFLSNV